MRFRRLRRRCRLTRSTWPSLVPDRAPRPLHAAGTVGIFSDIVMAVGVLLVAFELVRRERSIAAAGWIAMFLSIVVFTFVDAIGGYVLAPLAG